MTKKLSLNRETLVRLSFQTVRTIAAGTGDTLDCLSTQCDGTIENCGTNAPTVACSETCPVPHSGQTAGSGNPTCENFGCGMNNVTCVC